MDMEILERLESEQPPVPGPSPWLVYPCGKHRKNQFFCIPNSEHVEIKSVPELRKTEIWACVDGWLLLHEIDHKIDHLLLLWDPLTSKSIKLPSLPYIETKTIGGKIFTSAPTKPRCTVLLLDMYRPIIRYCRPSDRNWRYFDCETELANAFGQVNGGIHFGKVGCVDGVLYTYTCSAVHIPQMVSIKVDPNQNCIHVEILELTLPSSRNYSHTQWSYFVESLGELYYIEICGLGEFQVQVVGLEVFKLDCSQMVWIKVDSLTKQTFYLSQGGCTWCLAEEIGCKGNRIHFVLPEDKHLYTYDLGDGRVLTSLPCQSLETPWFPPSWVKPNYSRSDIEVEAEEAIVGEEEASEGPMEVEPAADEEQHQQHLQLDTLEVIARQLPVLDYLQFRAGCRLFRSAAPIVQWRTKPISWDVQFPYPMLVTFRNDQNVFSLVDPKNHDTYYMNIPESLRGSTISCSKDGYLLLVDNDALLYFNPLTKKQGQFPKTPDPFFGLTFSSGPSSSDCSVVEIDGWKKFVTVNFIRPGDEYWWFWIFPTNQEFIPSYNAPVYCDGKFYCMDQKGNLGIFQIIEGYGGDWEVIADLQAPCVAAHHNYLAKFQDGFLAVLVGQNGGWVGVFRRDQTGTAWIRVRNLGNYMLFVSRASSFAAIAKVSEMENKIYFPRFYGGRIIYYSLETGKFHTHGNHEEIADFTGTQEQLYSGWIELRGD